MKITQEVAGVPAMSLPVYWDADKSADVNMAVLGRYMGKYSDMLPDGTVFDEAAILVPSPYHRTVFANDLAVFGWDLFNQAEDLVFTNPFGTRYLVEYWFFQKPGVPYRLEVMMKSVDKNDQAGFSPLHEALQYPTWMNDGIDYNDESRLYPIPHLSFKVKQRAMQRPMQAYATTVQHMKDHDFLHAMSCQSSYGAFSYWLHNTEQKQIYVKPRVNTRDIDSRAPREEVAA